MNAELLNLPFDHFQRYATTAELIRSLGGQAISSILEVGANRQRVLKQFMPEVDFVFSDLSLQDISEGAGDAFVQADATQLPFPDRTFDVVVCLDVMEHIPAHLRASAAAEMARVSGRAVIICCPLDYSWVHEAEKGANSVWEKQFGQAYPWLEEHKEFGLVAAGCVENSLSAQGLQVLHFGQGNVSVWSGMMKAHFIKELVPELSGLVREADYLYNLSVFRGDRGERSYREFFVGTRDHASLRSLSSSDFLQAHVVSPSSHFLASLPDLLTPTVERLINAEKQWSATAETVRELERTLADERHLATQTHGELRQATKHAEELKCAIAGLEEKNDGLEHASLLLKDEVVRLERKGMDSARIVEELQIQVLELQGNWTNANETRNNLEQALGLSRRDCEILNVRVKVLEGRQRLSIRVLFGFAFAAAAATLGRYFLY